MIQSLQNLNTTPIKNTLNRCFFVFDCILTVAGLVFSIIYYNNLCLEGFYLCVSLFYVAQTMQHFLMLKIDHIDVELYNLVIRRIIAFVGLINVIYLFGCIVFWQRAPYHPLYCALCEYYQISLFVGILLVFHMILSVLFFVTLIHKFVKRRYYLLAIGGFQVEQRRMQMITQINARQQILQPNYNQYPLPENNKTGKYYNFQDIEQGDEVPENFICSICLTAQSEGHSIVSTSCNHRFHRDCIENWSRVNPKCPDCRTNFQVIKIPLEMPMKPVQELHNNSEYVPKKTIFQSSLPQIKEQINES